MNYAVKRAQQSETNYIIIRRGKLRITMEIKLAESFLDFYFRIARMLHVHHMDIRLIYKSEPLIITEDNFSFLQNTMLPARSDANNPIIFDLVYRVWPVKLTTRERYDLYVQHLEKFELEKVEAEKKRLEEEERKAHESKKKQPAKPKFSPMPRKRKKKKKKTSEPKGPIPIPTIWEEVLSFEEDEMPLP
ncbi:hypothetical protein SNEBB_005760 [Seison nebaliae]|nr:hypothetical protein SNEBB_005760 [Seison nebaliae]